MNELLKVNSLTKYFEIKRGFFIRKTVKLHAVDGVSFSTKSGENLGIVGESGCGKSTIARLILRLIEPDDGSIEFEGQNITGVKRKQLRSLRKRMQIIFQDQFSSFNPRMKVGKIISQGLETHNLAKGSEKEAMIDSMLHKVGLSPEFKNRYPHEFSGGQRQRIGIARALVLNPKLIIADEPVSALDVSIQAQVLNLMKDLQSEFGISYIFISHDLAVVQHISDRIAVMYLGKILELATDHAIYNYPQHPYTQALLSALPIADPTIQRKNKIILNGDIPSPVNPPKGCRFHTRCPYVRNDCKNIEPEFRDIGNRHFVACHLR